LGEGRAPCVTQRKGWEGAPIGEKDEVIASGI